MIRRTPPFLVRVATVGAALFIAAGACAFGPTAMLRPPSLQAPARGPLDSRPVDLHFGAGGGAGKLQNGERDIENTAFVFGQAGVAAHLPNLDVEVLFFGGTAEFFGFGMGLRPNWRGEFFEVGLHLSGGFLWADVGLTLAWFLGDVQLYVEPTFSPYRQSGTLRFPIGLAARLTKLIELRAEFTYAFGNELYADDFRTDIQLYAGALGLAVHF